LDDAVNSVLAQTFSDIEIIIVNDGSTDAFTNNLLATYDKPKTTVITTDNQGLAAARNTGIHSSSGTYILPLDADDKIGPEYAEEAVKILDEQPDVGIVYCNAEFFGEVSGKWELPEFSFQQMLLGNHIFCSAFFRREDYDQTPGYNPNMQYGWEDWDFWLSILELNKKAHKINRTLFYYRKRKASMLESMTHEQHRAMRQQVFRNHLKLYSDNFPDPINLYFEKQEIESKYSQIKMQTESLEYKICRTLTAPLRFASHFFKKR